MYRKCKWAKTAMRLGRAVAGGVGLWTALLLLIGLLRSISVNGNVTAVLLSKLNFNDIGTENQEFLLALALLVVALTLYVGGWLCYKLSKCHLEEYQYRWNLR